MISITRLRGAGFAVRLTSDGRIGITPVENLSENQRAWIGINLDILLAELRNEPANESVNVDIDLSTSRWQTFVDLTCGHGVTVQEVQAQFTEQDISDLLDEPIENLPLHARTIAESIYRYRLRATCMSETRS